MYKGWSRWLCAVVYGLALMAMACISFSWQQYSLILMKGGAYEWMCTDAQIEAAGDTPPYCHEQEKATGDLFSYLQTAQALSGLVAGVVVDHLGRRICASIGSLLAISAHVCLIFPSHSAFLVSTFLDGFSCNLIAFPALVLADFFPSHPVAATAFVLTAEFLGAIVTPILWFIIRKLPHLTMQRLWTVYILTVMLPISILYIPLIPPTKYAQEKKLQENLLLNQRIQAQNLKLQALDNASSTHLHIPYDDRTDYLNATPETLPPDKFLNDESPTHSTSSHLKSPSTASFLSPPDTLSYPTQPAPADDPNHALPPPSSDIAVNEPLRSTPALPPTVPNVERDFLHSLKYCITNEIFTVHFGLFEIIFNLFMLQHTFYPTVLRDMSGYKVSSYQGVFQSSQCFWALVIGAICDYTSTTVAAFGISLIGLLVFLLTLVRSEEFQYLVVSVFTIIHSYVYTIRFTFVREFYAPDNRGKILGIIGLGSALTTLLNVPINRTTRYELWLVVMSGTCLLQWPVIWTLHVIYRRSYRFRSPPKVCKCKKVEV